MCQNSQATVELFDLRSAVRSSGSFNISTIEGVQQGISWKACTPVHKADGFGPVLKRRVSNLLPSHTHIFLMINEQTATKLAERIFNATFSGMAAQVEAQGTSLVDHPDALWRIMETSAQLTQATIMAMALPAESFVPELSDGERAETPETIQGILGDK